jgi:hypothetical protein
MSEKKFEKKYHFWRLSWVFQIFVGLSIMFFTCFTYATSTTYFKVEEPLMPGTYSSFEMPNAEITRMVHNFLGLLEIYNFNNAKENFELARKYVHPTYLDAFDSHYMERELQAITFNKRSQTMELDLYGIDIQRQNDDEIIVGLYGYGSKIANNIETEAATNQH